MSNLHDGGHPLRHDGSRFPDDQSQWSPEESHYLQASWFPVKEHDNEDVGQAMVVAAAEMPSDGSSIA